MSTLITSTSDPDLHAELLALWDGEAGWVMLDHTHYQVMPLDAGAVGFVERETVADLLDSRSFGNTGGQYTKLDA